LNMWPSLSTTRPATSPRLASGIEPGIPAELQAPLDCCFEAPAGAPDLGPRNSA
jgi:hypothetical protein